MECRTTRNADRSGQALAEFAIALPALLTLFALMTVLVAGLGARALLATEAYALARAHLYGNALARCSPSSLWPRIAALEVRYVCSGRGRAQGHLLWNKAPQFEVVVNLETRP